MTLDEDLIKAVDKAARKLNTNRSAFTRDALRAALVRLSTLALERKHQQGYELHPAGKNEFSIWENEQNWGEE